MLVTKSELKNFGKLGEKNKKPPLSLPPIKKSKPSVPIKLVPIPGKPGLPPIPGLSKDYAKKRAELKKQYKLHTENARIQKIK